MWNFFRLENEHLNNCGEFRAVRDISVAPLNADDQTLLEQMMDQEDGVRNRQGKKSWKRSYSMSLKRPRLASQYEHHLCIYTHINGRVLFHVEFDLKLARQTKTTSINENFKDVFTEFV